MGDPVSLVSGLQSCLQQSISKRRYTGSSISWSWVCIKLVNLLSNYPSGVTHAIAMSELDNEFQKSGGKLNPFHSLQHQRVTTVASVLDSKSVQFESVLEVYIPSFHDIPGTTTKIAHLVDSEGDERHLQMYLHRKFYDIIQILNTHTVRVSCCRLVTSSASSKGGSTLQLCFLPTEHMAVLVDAIEAREMEDRFSAGNSHMNVIQPAYVDNIRAKVVNVGETEVLYSSDGTSYHRLIVQLGIDEGDSIPLILWDSYTGYARLFNKGDTLFIERPYARPTNSSSNGSSFCLEFGPVTLLYVLPYVPEQEFLLSQHPTQLTITVKKTDDGKLDFLSYPERLCITDLQPSMINGVLMAQCLKVRKRERITEEEEPTAYDLFQIEVQDNTGSVSVTVADPTFKVFDNIHQYQWLLITELSSEVCDDALSLSCNMRRGGQVFNVSALPGLLMSPDLYSTLTLEEARYLQPLMHFMVSATLESWVLPQDEATPQQLLKPTHCVCKGRVEMVNDEQICPICHSSGLTMLKSSETMKKSLSSYWKWAYNLKAVLNDESDCSITVQLTSDSAEALLQTSAEEASLLSQEELHKLLAQPTNTRINACISKVNMEVYQLNCVLVQDYTP